jgi:hypothetical protein
MQVLFEKVPGGWLRPVGEDAEAYVASLKPGAGIKVDVTKVRNPGFHRKCLKLIRTAFELWVPAGEPVDGIIPAKDFESFRERVLILAGHCDVVWNLDGTFTHKARSIAFANCGEYEFQKVYRNVLDVVWERVMKQANYRSPEEVDAVVNQLLQYT